MMIRKTWGDFHVSSAFDVAQLLRCVALEHLPASAPVWGDEDERIRRLRALGFAVWSWDANGIAFSRPDGAPPEVFYRDWRYYELIADDSEPLTERMPQSVGSAPVSAC